MGLQSRGFTTTAVECLARESTAPSPLVVAIGYCQGTPMRGEIEAHGADALDTATQVAADAITARFGPGPVAGRIRAYVLTAWR